MPALTPDEMRRRLDGEPVARLATIGGGGRPHLVPVCFAWSADAIVSAVDAKPKRTTALRRLANVRAHPDVSLLADHYETDWTRLWWVRVDGRAELVEEGPDHAQAVAALVARYAQYRERPPIGTVVRIHPRVWHGWSAT